MARAPVDRPAGDDDRARRRPQRRGCEVVGGRDRQQPVGVQRRRQVVGLQRGVELSQRLDGAVGAVAKGDVDRRSAVEGGEGQRLAIDATGIHAIETFAKRLTESGRTLLLCGAMQQPSKLLQQPRFLDHVGRANIMPNVQAALDRAKEVYDAGAVLAS